MKFACERCGKRFASVDEPSPGRVYRIRCRCGNVIQISAPRAGAVDPGHAGPLPLPGTAWISGGVLMADGAAPAAVAAPPSQPEPPRDHVISPPPPSPPANVDGPDSGAELPVSDELERPAKKRHKVLLGAMAIAVLAAVAVAVGARLVLHLGR